MEEQDVSSAVEPINEVENAVVEEPEEVSSGGVSGVDVESLQAEIERLKAEIEAGRLRESEAEERGYKRGVNEQIECVMARPGVYEESAGESECSDETTEVLILNNMRQSVWDR